MLTPIHNVIDRELLNAYKTRADHTVFSQIIERHTGTVYAVCLRVLGDTHAAEDASQAVFLILMKKAQELPKTVVLSGWLYQTALGVALNARKTRARRQHHEREAVIMNAPHQSTAQALWSEIIPHIDAAMAKLPAAQRDAIVLCYLEGRSREDAAAEIGCPVKTLNSRISLALEKLRADLGRLGTATPAAVLATQLSANCSCSVPAGLTAQICGACASHSASAGAAAMVEGFAKAILWAKIKIAAAVCSALLFFGALTPLLYRSIAVASPSQTGPALDTKDDKSPANEKVNKGAFVPKGGKIIARVKLPQRLPNNEYSTPEILWNLNNTKLMFTTSVELSKKGVQDGGDIVRCTVHSVDVAMQSTATLFTYDGIRGGAHWVEGDRILVQNGWEVSLYEKNGANKRIRLATETFNSRPYPLQVSPSGKYFSICGVNKRALVTYAGKTQSDAALQLQPPALKPDKPGLAMECCSDGWTTEDKLIILTYWTKDEFLSPHEQQQYWLYDPQAEKFEELPLNGQVLEPGAHFSQRFFNKPETDRSLWKLPGARRLQRILAEHGELNPEPLKPPASQNAKANETANYQADRRAGTAAAVELLDATGKLIKRIALDVNELDGADIWPQSVSADGRFVLASTFKSFRFQFGAPWGGWEPVREKEVLLDLEDGRLVAGFSAGKLHPPRSGLIAIMSPSREVLLLDNDSIDYATDNNAKNSNHGIWSIPFNGKARNFAEEMGLNALWAGIHRYPGVNPNRGMFSDRIAILVRPQAYIKAPGPRHLLVCYNSARPIVAYTSLDLHDEPGNVIWSRDGGLMAFTIGDTICVWKPTEEPTLSEPNATGNSF